MVKKGVIARNLRDIEALYDKATSAKKQIFFSKLALLELCGWLESVQDELVRESVMRCISDAANQNIVHARIKRTHGFDYDNNFRPLLILIAGISRLEKIERDFDKFGSFTKFRGLLSKLKDPRNTAAHTHTSGLLTNIDAPSVVRKFLEELFLYMRELEKILKRYRY